MDCWRDKKEEFITVQQSFGARCCEYFVDFIPLAVFVAFPWNSLYFPFSPEISCNARFASDWAEFYLIVHTTTGHDKGKTINFFCI